MKKTVTILLMLVMALWAQSQEKLPGWISKPPKPGNSSYTYVVQHAGGRTQMEARNNALNEVYRTAIMQLGIRVDWEEIEKSLKEGNDWQSIALKYGIPVKRVCEATDKRENTQTANPYIVYVLCQVSTDNSQYPKFDEFRGCNDTKSYSNAISLVESIFIPGLGQMTKHRGGHGTGVLLGELVFVGGGVTSYYFAKQELDKMKDPNVTFADFQAAKKNYKLFRIANIAAFSAAAALYVGNLFQAYFIKPKYKDNKRLLSFYPSIIPTEDDVAAGVGLTFNF